MSLVNVSDQVESVLPKIKLKELSSYKRLSAPQSLNVYKGKLLQHKRNRSCLKEKRKPKKSQRKIRKQINEVITSLKLNEDDLLEKNKENDLRKELSCGIDKENVRIKELFQSKEKLYAKVEMKKSVGGKVVTNENIILTEELYEKALGKLFKYYEERITKNNPLNDKQI